MKDLIGFIVAVAICLTVGLLGSVITVENIPTWYATLNKPFFTPPSWLFGPAWTLLYILMGISAYLIFRQGLDKKPVRFALILFLVQLILNGLWTPLFFGLHWLLPAFIELVLLWLFILWTIIAFYRLSPLGGWLLIPYLLWVSFASTLNFAVWWLNR